jgi:hypothetical protein
MAEIDIDAGNRLKAKFGKWAKFDRVPFWTVPGCERRTEKKENLDLA